MSPLGNRSAGPRILLQPKVTLRRVVRGAPVALVASVTLAACGGSSHSGAGTASATATGVKYATCMRADGVPDFPDPQSGGGESIDRSPTKIAIDGRTLAESPRVVQTAMNRCVKYSPTSQGARTSAGQLVKLRARAVAMARCMRAHGVPDYPDPTIKPGPGGHGFVISIPGGPHAAGPVVDAAKRRCPW
jgi:hypothetical protein